MGPRAPGTRRSGGGVLRSRHGGRGARRCRRGVDRRPGDVLRPLRRPPPLPRRRPALRGREDVKDRIAAELEAVRKRSLDLLEPVSEDDLLRQHSPLMSPLVWDLAHVGNYEEQWLLGAVGSTRVAAHLDEVYDAFKNPRRDRPQLDLLGPEPARAYVSEI